MKGFSKKIFARGAFNTVTNSAVGAAGALLDTLCGCAAEDSRGGRAFARCPPGAAVSEVAEGK